MKQIGKPSVVLVEEWEPVGLHQATANQRPEHLLFAPDSVANIVTLTELIDGPTKVQANIVKIAHHVPGRLKPVRAIEVSVLREHIRRERNIWHDRRRNQIRE